MSADRTVDSEECLRWDERYASEPRFFGDLPNPYLVETVERLFESVADRTPAALCLGEGEGRDALFLAGRGFSVTAVDGSMTGLQKLARRAEAARLPIHVVHADLARYEPAAEVYDLVSAFYCHLEPATRRAAHARSVLALRPGGYFILEGFTPRQRELGLTSGGPRDVRLLFEPEVLRSELDRDLGDGGLILRELGEITSHIACGRHRGEARVVRLLGQRPAAPGARAACSRPGRA